MTCVRLFNAGTMVGAGQTVSSNEVSVLGYNAKTILFVATQNGTIAVQIYTLNGNWVTIDSISYTANTVFYYVLVGGAQSLRIRYTNTATSSATIQDAEIYLE